MNPGEGELVFPELKEGYKRGGMFGGGEGGEGMKGGFVLSGRSSAFCCSVMLLGRISGRDLFDVTHGIVLRDRFVFFVLLLFVVVVIILLL